MALAMKFAVQRPVTVSSDSDSAVQCKYSGNTLDLATAPVGMVEEYELSKAQTTRVTK